MESNFKILLNRTEHKKGPEQYFAQAPSTSIFGGVNLEAILIYTVLHIRKID